MTTLKTGARLQKEKGRTTLTVAPTLVKTTLAAGDFQIHHVAGATRFYKLLVNDRNRWDINRRRYGLFSGRIKKVDADPALKRALDALEGGAL